MSKRRKEKEREKNWRKPQTMLTLHKDCGMFFNGTAFIVLSIKCDYETLLSSFRVIEIVI